MYGLVNKAIKEMMIQEYGTNGWQAICEAVDLENDHFINLQPYPDELTYQMVTAAARYANQPVPDILKAFGHHWIKYTGQNGYGDMLNLGGHDLPTFLSNLDRMHAGMSHAYPELRPPSFRCETLSPNKLRLHYQSEREGLPPFVIGLLEGLGEYLNTPLRVDHSGPCDLDQNCEVFHIDLLEEA